MGLAEQIMTLVAMLDEFCITYWDIIACTIVGFAAILMMVIVLNNDNRRLR